VEKSNIGDGFKTLRHFYLGQRESESGLVTDNKSE